MQLDEASILRTARSCGPRLPIAAIVIRQAWAEMRLKLRGISFRKQENQAACSAYGEMTPREFAAINARQAWANWRVIPRNLHGLLPRRPVRMVDLCCGVGQSTEVLAHYAAPGSRIIGIEINRQLVDAARRRFASHARCQVEFSPQSVLSRFCDAQGVELEDQSIDVVHASGAVSCHFDSVATDVLIHESVRVLRPNGLALVDSGEAGTDADTLRIIADRHGLALVRSASSCCFDRSSQLCFVNRNLKAVH